MPSDRTFHPAEQARRDAYDHGSAKDSNFNPLASRMPKNAGDTRGIREMAKDMHEAGSVDLSVPRNRSGE